jgi:hypothetical protein
MTSETSQALRRALAAERDAHDKTREELADRDRRLSCERAAMSGTLETLADLKAEQSKLNVLLFTTEQASPEPLPPCGVESMVLASNAYDQVIKISDQMVEHFGDDSEHLGQPYGNVYDAIGDALGRLIDELAELKAARVPSWTEDAPDVWLIKHIGNAGADLWWRANSSGYTTELIAAGAYAEAEAVKSAANRPSEDKAVRLVDALNGLDVVGTVAGLLGWLPLPDEGTR